MISWKTSSSRMPSNAAQAGHPLTLRLQPGYDHSYYFIASFIDDHLRHHAKALLRVRSCLVRAMVLPG